MIEFTLALLAVMLILCVGVAVLVFGVMAYDAITAQPFVSRKGSKWDVIDNSLATK